MSAVRSLIPARLDRLPWSRWHWLVVFALGVIWLLDGLQVTVGAAVCGILREPQGLGLTNAQLGVSGSLAVVGAVVGALVFGYLTDLWGRKRLFYLTLLLYLLATAATGFAWNFASFTFFRALASAGIGGEYAAINSAIDELIPARVRGRVGLAINATFWIGAVLGSGVAVALLNAHWIPAWLGWRLTFGVGALLGAGILVVRRWVPESPRWLMLHGRIAEAEETVAAIERSVEGRSGPLPPPLGAPISLIPRRSTPWREIWRAMMNLYPERSFLSFCLMSTQAFFYSAIFFSYPLILIRFFAVPSEKVGLYLIAFAVGNFTGPFFLGPLFDRIGRKPMIAATYFLSGLFLAVASWLFLIHSATALTLTLAFVAVFFVASAAASSAYVTVSEIFPLEIRALAIAIFYALGTLAGGGLAPLLFGRLLSAAGRLPVAGGYLLAAASMVAAAVVEIRFGVRAERRSLEQIAVPLSHALENIEEDPRPDGEEALSR